MKIDQEQIDGLEQRIVEKVAVLIEGVRNEVESLAISTKIGFDRVHARIDGVENRIGGLDNRIDSLENRMNILTEEVKLNHEEIVLLRSDMNRKFDLVDTQIRLRKLILD
jgi:hypothetical protein